MSGGNIIKFKGCISNTQPSEYFDENFLGDPLIGEVLSSADLVGNDIKIVQGKGEGQARTITGLRDGDKCEVGLPFDPIPNSISKFKIISSTVFEVNEKLIIIPYDFKNGPTYTYTGPS